MPAQKKQHYIPQFYMKEFANEKGGISILNLSDYSVRNEVPYKSQCSIDYFYGKDGEMENLLSRRESEWAVVLRKLNDETPLTTVDMQTIREFVVYQRQRTEAEDLNTKDEKEAIIKEIAKMKLDHENIQFSDEELTEYCKKAAIEHTSPGENLKLVKDLSNMIEDLTMMAIRYDIQNELVFSDAPVISINPFYPMSIGYGCMGLILLLPISPHRLLVLYDNGIYHANSTDFYQVSTDDDEVKHLNILQLISAEKRVMGYSDIGFSHYDIMAKDLRSKNREQDHPGALGSKNRKLLITSMRKCTYLHDWNFLQISRKAAKVPVVCREAVLREWSPGWDDKLKQKAVILPQIKEVVPAGMTEKEFIYGLQKMSSFAMEYWRNREKK